MKWLILNMLFGVTFSCYSQKRIEFSFTQPSELIVNAGVSLLVPRGKEIKLGGSPTARGGTNQYTYLWNPATYLNDRTIANPIAFPLDDITYTVEVDDGICLRTDEVILRVQTITATDLELENEPIVYPNPASNTITINIPPKWQNKSIHLLIMNISGKLAFDSIIGDQTEIEIDVSGWAKTNYVIQLRGDEVNLIKRFILQ